MKVGRNDPCPCGSGKKFKKCCVDKPEYQWRPPDPKPPMKPQKRQMVLPSRRVENKRIPELRWSFDNVRAMSSPAIFEKLNALGISLDEAIIREQAGNFESIGQFLDRYKSKDDRLELGEDADFPWLALYTLTERICPDKPFLDHVGFWIMDGYHMQHINEKTTSDFWWRVWEFVIAWARKNDIRSLEVLDDSLSEFLDGFVSNWLMDLEELLGNLWNEGEIYTRKRLDLARAVQLQFPVSNLNLLNWGRAEGESLFRLGDPVAGDEVYKSLLQRYPDEAWAYIGWGDQYSPTFATVPAYVDFEKALQIYRMGLDHEPLENEAIRERIGLLKGDLENA
ncbi:MAG: SEC-C metal-binding domain-containing protein [Firmicutes bacterium]|nr:SEC-C metal-binding domain-containing protein [Bacillota bacterium]